MIFAIVDASQSDISVDQLGQQRTGATAGTLLLRVL